MDLGTKVATALDSSVLPTLIARGGAVRVVAVTDGVARLEMTGSPGAVLPLVSRIEELIVAAVPEITGVTIVGPATGPDTDETLAERARRVLDTEINPAIAAHHGHIALAGVHQGWIRVRLDGGCQGCSLAEVTLRQGIEPLLRMRLPDMVGLVDTTDHVAGTHPFFSPSKR